MTPWLSQWTTIASFCEVSSPTNPLNRLTSLKDSVMAVCLCVRDRQCNNRLTTSLPTCRSSTQIENVTQSCYFVVKIPTITESQWPLMSSLVLPNIKHKFVVPRKYLRIHFTASQCPFSGHDMYMFTIYSNHSIYQVTLTHSTSIRNSRHILFFLNGLWWHISWKPKVRNQWCRHRLSN